MKKILWTYINSKLEVFNFCSIKKITLNCIKSVLTKNNVTVISLMMFCENSNTVVFRVLGSVVCTIIDSLICLGYLCLFQDKLPKHYSNFENLMTCLGLRYLNFLWISCPVMDFQKFHYRHLSWHVSLHFFLIVFLKDWSLLKQKSLV